MFLRFLSLTAVIMFASSVVVSDADAAARARKVNSRRALAASCPKVRSLDSTEIYKSIASHHIPTSDPRRSSTSFIDAGGTAPSSSCLYGYNSKGTQIHSLGRYWPNGPYRGRWYGGSGCGDKKRASAVKSAARANGGNGSLYLKVSSSTCAIVPDPSRCYNSSGC